MRPVKAAMIGFLPEGKDPYPLLEAYAGLGYRGFETADILLDGNPVENRKRVESFGMEPLVLRYEAESPPTVSALIHNAKLTGVRRVVCYAGAAGCCRFGQRDTPPGYDDILREAEEFDRVAKVLSQDGIDFLFHNHDVDFTQAMRGVPLFWLLAANTEYLKFEVDCGWAAYAGYDPAGLLRTLGSRVGLVHIKDFVPGTVERLHPSGKTTSMPRFTTPGTGLLDLGGCLRAAAELGQEWAIVEQDFQYHLTETETLTAALCNMRETGLVV